MVRSHLVVVETFNNRLEIELARGALEAAGIEAAIEADTAGGMREHLASSGPGFRLIVRAEDAKAASDALSPRRRKRGR